MAGRSSGRRIHLILLIAMCLTIFSPSVTLAKVIHLPKGQKTLIAFWKCVGWWYCNLKLHIDIRRPDGSPGRARLIGNWEPGRTHDLDVHEGSYDDSLDAYFFMAYWLYAIAETDDVSVTVGNNVDPDASN
jgi:hypothetical protein